MDVKLRQLGFQQSSRRPHARGRAGFVSLKLILLVPVLLTLLALVLEVGNLWLARIELENSLEAAALAAVKEWGDDNGNSGTFVPRQVGNEYGRANTMRGMPVDLSSIDPTLNRDPGSLPNENRTCPEGVFVFGAITDFDPEVVFNASVRPNCGGDGALLFDASQQGNMTADNSWGVSFRTNPDPLVNQFLRVDRIVIDMDPNNTGEARFNFTNAPPILSDNSPQEAVQDNSGNSQPDNFGFSQAPGRPTNQVSFNPSNGISPTLEIVFGPDGGDEGFSPGDRFRFGATIERRQGATYQQAAGDDVGQIPVQVTVFFSFNGVPNPIPSIGEFFDNKTMGLDRDNDCLDPGKEVFDDLGNRHLVVHGREIVDLPCPPTSSANNNGQSFLELNGGGRGEPYAVRAQAEVEVPSVIERLFGCRLGPFRVQAQATAYYDCERRRPCLIRVDRFLCN